MTMALSFEARPVPLRLDEHGVVRVIGSRITLDTVLSGFHRSSTPEQVVQSFPTLKLADVYAIFAYYLDHREEVDAYLREQEEAAAEVRKLVESQPGYWEFRERLQERKRAYLQSR